MSFVDLYRELHREMIREEYPPSARVLIMTLAGEFNGAHWTDELSYSERDLMYLTGLKKTTLHDAKQYLVECGAIRCEVGKSRTHFRLGERLRAWLNRGQVNQPVNQLNQRDSYQRDDYQPVNQLNQRDDYQPVTQPTTNRPPTDHQPTTNRPPTDHLPTGSENSNIRARTQDGKDGKDSSSFVRSSAHARAPVNWNCEIEERLTDLWERNGGVRLTFERLSYIKSLVDKHGLEWTESLIREAIDAFGGGKDDYGRQYSMNINFLRGCAERKLRGDKNNDNARTSRVVDFYRHAGRRGQLGARTYGADGSRNGRVATQADGQGRFDGDAPDCGWLRESDGDTSGTEN